MRTLPRKALLRVAENVGVSCSQAAIEALDPSAETSMLIRLSQN
jgi:hypothetical protein